MQALWVFTFHLPPDDFTNNDFQTLEPTIQNVLLYPFYPQRPNSIP
jgi:hypothetical protein